VRALTLAGPGLDGMAGAGQVSLTTHVTEATAAVMAAGEPVVLVGHSYGGSVITGWPIRYPSRCVRSCTSTRSSPTRAPRVAATEWPEGSTPPFTSTSDRVAADPAWTVHRWPTRHNVLHDGPGCLLDLLLAT
jgi:pimeloyl-ACP methyl ester carboxylesterase